MAVIDRNYKGYEYFLAPAMYDTLNGCVILKRGQKGFGYQHNYMHSMINCPGGITEDTNYTNFHDPELNERLISFDMLHAGVYIPELAKAMKADGLDPMSKEIVKKHPEIKPYMGWHKFDDKKHHWTKKELCTACQSIIDQIIKGRY